MGSSRSLFNECNTLTIYYFNTVNIFIRYEQCDNRKVDLMINLYHIINSIILLLLFKICELHINF